MKLREYREEDAGVIAGWLRSEEELYKWSADRFNKYPLSGKDINENYAPQLKAGRFIPLTAVDDSEELVGHFIIRYPRADDNSSVRFGFVIVDPAIRGKGFGKGLLRLGIEYVKKHLGATRIDLGVFENNESARHCYEAAGFTEYARRKCMLPIGIWNCADMEMFVKRDLETERLILRGWEDCDAEDLFKYARDPDVGPIAGWPPHRNVDESRDVIRNVLNGKEAYAICLKEDGRAIGAIELKLNGHTDMTDRDDECEMGYWLGKPFWGQGIMPEAVKEMLRHAFEDCGMQKVWIGYYEGNDKSKRVQEKCGFRYQWQSEDVDVPLMHEKRTGYVSMMTKGDWQASRSGKEVSIRLKPVVREDVETVWKMQIEAFSDLLQKYQDHDMSPAAESPDKVAARFEQPWTAYFFIMAGDEKVGVIRVADKKDGSRKRISPVWIMPEYRNKGYAQQAILAVERRFGSHHWCLDTILQEKGNLHLYEKLGYRQTGRVDKINDRMDIVYYEKD